MFLFNILLTVFKSSSQPLMPGGHHQLHSTNVLFAYLTETNLDLYSVQHKTNFCVGKLNEDSGRFRSLEKRPKHDCVVSAFSNTFHKKIYIYIYIYLSKMQLHISETTKCIPLNRFWGIQFSTKGQLLFTKGLNSTGLQALIVWRLTIVTNGKEGKTRHKSVPWILIEMYSKV